MAWYRVSEIWREGDMGAPKYTYWEADDTNMLSDMLTEEAMSLGYVHLEGWRGWERTEVELPPQSYCVAEAEKVQRRIQSLTAELERWEALARQERRALAAPPRAPFSTFGKSPAEVLTSFITMAARRPDRTIRVSDESIVLLWGDDVALTVQLEDGDLLLSGNLAREDPPASPSPLYQWDPYIDGHLEDTINRVFRYLEKKRAEHRQNTGQ